MNHNRLVIGLLLLLLFISGGLSLMSGARFISLPTVIDALIGRHPFELDSILVTSGRLSRTIIAVLAGASLAVAGALMQAMTGNPIASPGLFGINAGAMFAIVVSLTLLPGTGMSAFIWLAMTGAIAAGGVVFFLGSGSRGKNQPMRLVLAGAAVTALFVSFTQALLVINQDGLDSILFWLAGSVADRTLETVRPLLPFPLLSLAGCWLLAGHINILAAGEDIARGLGQNTARVRLLMALAVAALAGSAVAMAGSIAFIGLIVPHIARRLLGLDHRWLLPGSALLGSSFLLLADTLARVIILPEELPVGVMTAFVGAPVFIVMIRRRRGYE